MNHATSVSAQVGSISILLLLLTLGVMAAAWWWMKRNFQQRLQLAQQNALVSALMDVEETAILVNSQGRIESMNPSAERLLGYRLRQARNKHHNDILLLADSIKHTPIDWVKMARSSAPSIFRAGLLSSKNLQELQASFLARVVNMDGIDEPFVLLLLKDQAEIKALQVRLKYLEMHDPRTGLLNRRFFEISLKNALDEARQQGVKHSYIHIALDQFKLVNDTIGHSAGDAFIERVSVLLKGSIDQRRDVLARIGGDEFGILFREIEPAQALKFSELIRLRIEKEQFKWNAHNHQITASIGFVPILKRSGTPNRVLSLADAACRVAKGKGGNHLHIYRPDDEEIKKHRGQLVWLGRLRKAFEKGQFRLFAQPIHSLIPAEFQKPFHHYETLIRLFDENGQPISPDEFIPAAEYYSMMPQMDRWVVRALIKELQKINRFEPLPIFAINLSGQSLDEEEFLQFVLDEIRNAQINPKMLCFEITERVAINNLDLANKFIDTLKEIGCSFSLDDFGTGVSSFSYLKSLPVDYLKIDGSFIRGIQTDDVARTMVESITQVGQVMNVKTIGEFAENDEVIRILREIGIDYGQGYGISKPIPLPEVMAAHVDR